MAKELLLIEDYPSVELDIKDDLRMFTTHSAAEYAMAIDIWDYYSSNIEAIILDLRITSSGMDDAERFSPFYSLAFLEYIFKGKNDSQVLELKKKIIIYSEYIESLRERRRFDKTFKIADGIEALRKSVENYPILIEKVKTLLK